MNILDGHLAKWIGFALVIAFLDQVTKYFATRHLSYGEPIAVMSGVNFTLLHNTGAAFSFLHDQGGWQRWLFVTLTLVISVGLIVWLKRLRKGDITTHIAICLILAGAFGNLADRLLWGYVIDFIQLYYSTWYWPTFNVADASISVGAALLIFKGGNGERVN